MGFVKLLSIALVVAFLSQGSTLHAQTLKPGKVHDKVIAAEDAEQSYALYLPSNYDPKKKWPVLLGFSPNANGKSVVDHYREGAERFGWIVVGSNVSRNGPNSVCEGAARAMWTDVQQRFSVDENRIYATGMSGGGGFATWLAQSDIVKIKGVFVHARGVFSLIPDEESETFYFLFTGEVDFNFGESVRFVERAKQAGATAFLSVRPGYHGWSPAAECTAALRFAHLLELASQGGKVDRIAAEFWSQEVEYLINRMYSPYFFPAFERMSWLRETLHGGGPWADKVLRKTKGGWKAWQKRAQWERPAWEELTSDCLFPVGPGGRWPSSESLLSTEKDLRRVVEKHAGTTAAHIALLTILTTPMSLKRVLKANPESADATGYQEFMDRSQQFESDPIAQAQSWLKKRKIERAIGCLYLAWYMPESPISKGSLSGKVWSPLRRAEGYKNLIKALEGRRWAIPTRR